MARLTGNMTTIPMRVQVDPVAFNKFEIAQKEVLAASNALIEATEKLRRASLDLQNSYRVVTHVEDSDGE